MQKKWDVLVAGSGPAGMAAAYGAARNGARVLLVEKDGFVGGMATSGLINSWRGTASSGFFERMQRISIRAWGQLIYDPEQAAELFRRIIEEYDINVLSQATVCAVKVNGKSNISSVQVLTRQGMMDFHARCYVDATGDGDLAAMAGVPYVMNDAETGNPTVFLMVQLGGIETRNNRCFSREQFESLVPLLKNAAQRGEIAELMGPLTVIPGVRGGTGMMKIIMNAPLDATDARDVVQAEFICRAQVIPLIEFLKKNMPGYSDCYLIRTASRVGLMQSRRIIGRYTVTLDDVDAGRTFSDWVVTRACPPQPAGSDRPCLPFTLPYDCLLPKKIKNLLLSGRCISGTQEAFERYQTMPICMATGQAAGTAAALAAANNGRVRKLDVQTLQDRLLQQGVAPPRPQFVLQGISPILTDNLPENHIKTKEPEEDDIPVIPPDAGSNLNPQQITEDFDEQDEYEEQPLPEDAHNGGESAVNELPAPEFSLNLEEMPDFDQLQAEASDAVQADELEDEEILPETADAVTPIPQQARSVQRAFRSDYELILEQLLNEEKPSVIKTHFEDVKSADTLDDEMGSSQCPDPEAATESKIEVQKTEEQNYDLDNEPIEPVSQTDNIEPVSANIEETDAVCTQEIGSEEPPAETRYMEQTPDQQSDPASETATADGADEFSEDALEEKEEDVQSDDENDVADDDEIGESIATDGCTDQQTNIVSPDEMSQDEQNENMETEIPLDMADDAISSDEQASMDEASQQSEPMLTIEEVQGSELPVYEETLSDSEPGTVLTITPQEPEVVEEEFTEEEVIKAEEECIDPGESDKTTESGNSSGTEIFRQPEPGMMQQQGRENAEEESSGSELTACLEDEPSRDNPMDTASQESEEKESQDLVHQQSPSGRTYTYHRKNPDDDPAVWNRFASELWEEWIGDGKSGKTKQKPNYDKPAESIEPENAQKNYTTLRRDGKSPLDIDVQDLL